MIDISDIKLGIYVHMRHETIPFPIVAKVIQIDPLGDGDHVKVAINLRGIDNAVVNCADLYETAYELKEAEDKKNVSKYYEKTSTVEGLLRFLSEHKMINWCIGDDAALEVIEKRLEEAGIF